MSGREGFGPPTNPVGAFVWAALQLPRAFVWTFREKQLRRHLVLPSIITCAVIVSLAALALQLVGPIEQALVDLPSGVLGTIASIGLTAVIAGFLLLAAVVVGWQLSAHIAAGSHERMALFVQRTVMGAAPQPTITAGAVVKRAVRGLFPSVRRLVIWALTSLASLTLVLVPAIGPLLVVIAQTAISALFLAHAAIADNRDRLGLPARLLIREPALLSGYALACVPFALFPPAMLFVSGPIAVGGALVAVGAQLRDSGASRGSNRRSISVAR